MSVHLDFKCTAHSRVQDTDNNQAYINTGSSVLCENGSTSSTVRSASFPIIWLPGSIPCIQECQYISYVDIIRAGAL